MLRLSPFAFFPTCPCKCTAVRIPTSGAFGSDHHRDGEARHGRSGERFFRTSRASSSATTSTRICTPCPSRPPAIADVEVGRIRHNDVFGENGLDFFICGDQLIGGAALNAVLVAEKARSFA